VTKWASRSSNREKLTGRSEDQEGKNDCVLGLLLDVKREVFQDFETSFEIWEWTTDWSPWFDAGHDWWGSFLYTVRLEDRFIGIAASETD
jgi:hypothetical protein